MHQPGDGRATPLMHQTSSRPLPFTDGSEDNVFSTSGHYQTGGHSPIKRPPDETTPYVIVLTLAAACGGFLFGYDTGVVSGAMLKIRAELGLSDVQQEAVVSATIAAAVVASALGGAASQAYGRRPVLLFAAATFTAGAALLGAAPGFGALLAGRAVVGAGIGLASLTAPVYIAEAAPTRLRGRLLTLNTLLITAGQFAAGMVDGALSAVPGGWRWMLGLSAAPALLMGAAFLVLPESPRWLLARGRADDAAAVLRRVRGVKDVSAEIAEVARGMEEHGDAGVGGGYGWRDMLRDPPVRRALLLGCGLQALQQFVGINTVMYYSATIYNMAGFSESASIWLAGFTALAQSGGVAIGMTLIERQGRRRLLLTSLALVAGALVSLGLSFYLQLVLSAGAVPGTEPADAACSAVRNVIFGPQPVDSCYRCLQIDGCGFCAATGECLAAAAGGGGGTDVLGRCDASQWKDAACSNGALGWLAALSMVAYLACFGIGLSSVPWTVNAEIYPQRARSLGTSVSTCVNWAGNVVVSATFLSIAAPTALSQHGAFWLYAAVAVAGWAWARAAMPETAGLSLEEVEALFERDGDARYSYAVTDVTGNGHGSAGGATVRGFAPLGDGDGGAERERSFSGDGDGDAGGGQGGSATAALI
ncbi:solute carrier family 2, member 13-like protein [Tribonema minus]|uniref:Hexose transporter 1 n=1 Tax=Tribonema minus TaxID=303371 RepID=A0A836CJI9_9STRA|nr:solute carrier family 2, member 13-like protein [Tribonema minus]